MNREINFRGEALENGEWIYGSFVDNTQCDFDSYISADNGDLIKIDRKTICQSTGLHDKNGVPIYEGDLVSYYKEELSIVKFIFGSFIVEGLETGHRESFYNLNGLAEVIGNIYVNENLLKQKDGK